jgi:hypothetical protein
MVTAPAPPLKDRRKASPSIGVLTLYGPLPETGYNLKRAIAIQVERDEGGSFVVSEANTGAYHYDVDFSRALSGFISAFIEEYELLLHHEGPLSAAMASDLERFQMLIEPFTR